ncbi:MAG: 4Fe-4S dicluster domain-containing protein [Acidobacteriota bacterium]|nr:4Fe-4S dicluster domain-containing protein [Blastocatellia bacterium]MDW8238912.1 4Fe-4S dicluster domain-containing protein [Acidobacteriota bacterium]
METLVEVLEKQSELNEAVQPRLISISIAGKRYAVPEGLTILKALEYAGYRLVRGVGCRGGFCGACATVYRVADDYRLKIGLACQTMIEENMYLTQIPFYPAQKATYDLRALRPAGDVFIRFYPEILRCLQCNTCRKVCPQDLDVMRYIAAAQRGEVDRVADLSFDCLQCGLCASRCPAEIAHYHVAQLGRRLYGRYRQPLAAHLSRRLAEITEGQFDDELSRLQRMSRQELESLYAQREIEPEETTPAKKDED